MEFLVSGFMLQGSSFENLKQETCNLKRFNEIRFTLHESLAGCSKSSSARPQRVKTRGVPLRYVEGLNDARTKLAGFFSILLRLIDWFRCDSQLFNRNPLENVQYSHNMFVLHAGIAAEHER